MKTIRNIKDFHITTKTSIFSVLGMSYYFFIAIYLFKVDLVDKIENSLLLDINFYLILLTSLSLSFAWYIMNIALTMSLLLFSNTNEEQSPSDIFISSMIYSIGFLSCALLINYLLDYDFKHFVAYSYLFVAIRIIWVFISLSFSKKV